MRMRLCAVLLSAFCLPQFAQAQTVKSGYALSAEKCGQGALAFPKLRITMQTGFCAGLVASKDDGLRFPRALVQVPDTRFFVVTDMGSWEPRQGRVLLLDPEAAEGKRIKVLLRDLDLPHGIAVGPDHRIYIGVTDRIFRFDPLSANPSATVENILQGLPGLRPVLSDGTQLARNAHPLKHFVFDRTGRIFVNVGAPSDACATAKAETKACAAGEGASPLAAVWMFTPPAGGVFPALRAGAANPPHEVYARGLRNSMALAPHPRFPDDGFAFMQGENARDLPEESRPNEELNALSQAKHYGWPYCYDLSTVSPEYAAFLKTNGPLHDLCANTALYRAPHSVMPPHGAPLGMLYYGADKFPDLKGKLIVGLHGYRPTGSRVLAYEVDDHGFPKVSAPPVRYNVSCGTPQVFRTETQKQIAAAPYVELISGWHKVNGVRPQGAPVGITVASDGAIWLAEDKNKTIIRIDAAPGGTMDALPCNARTPAQIAALADAAMKDTVQHKRLTEIRAKLIEPHCVSCHAGFDIKPGMNDTQKDNAVVRFILAQDGWVYPGDPDAGRMHNRVWGRGPEKVMPDNGRALLNDASYRALLTTLDEFVAKMAPAKR